MQQKYSTKEKNKIAIFSSCVTVCQPCRPHKGREPQDNMERKQTQQLNQLAENNLIILQCIPANSGRSGNERKTG
uniref:Uncharacterized protein n=1 Tax=Arion vulgaris TaxID=1028688 RepID=A0A0B6ZSP0_9EUPU